MITVVLVEPENEGNIGAVARAMGNFDFKDLLLINPKCNHLNLDAISRAKHAKEILKKAKVRKFPFLKKFDYVIGTTAKTGNDYNILRIPLTPEELANKISTKSKVALVFGRESDGLTNKEILECDFIVKIPTADKYKTLNLSHSVSIMLYELFKKKDKSDKTELASKKEKDILLEEISKIIKRSKFSTKEKEETQKKVWKKIVGKSMLTKREAFALIGFFKKIN
jgi:TrmH family RNA methyltransferase